MSIENVNTVRHNIVIEGGNIEVLPSLGEAVNAGWEHVVAFYIAQKDCLEASRATYTKGLVQFFHRLEETGKRLVDVTKQDIIDWKEDLFLSGHTGKTVKLYMVCVKGFFTWAESMKLCPNIAKDVKAERKRTNADKFVKMHLTDEQGSELLKYFKEKNLRDYALINLMIRTGLRSVEVHRANIDDIKEKNGRTLLYVQGKGERDKNEFVVLSDQVMKPIGEYLGTRSGEPADAPLFTCENRNCRGRRLSTRTIQFIGKEGMRAIGLDDHRYSIHSLRHTAGVQILMNGGSQFDVQDVLRHASPLTSQIYLESIKEERRIKSAPEYLLDRMFKTD